MLNVSKQKEKAGIWQLYLDNMLNMTKVRSTVKEGYNESITDAMWEVACEIVAAEKKQRRETAAEKRAAIKAGKELMMREVA